MLKLVIIDFSNLVFKAYYGIKAPLKSPSGIPTNAIFGFWNSLFKILEMTQPTHLVVCMEGLNKSNNPRKIIFPEYKINRIAPDDIKIQMKLIEEQLKLANVFCLRIEPFEADDSIASLMKQGNTLFDEIVVFSADKDLLQYVSNNTYLIDISNLKKMDASFVKEKYNLNPDQISDYLSIAGDSADNIPGVPGVGPKGAQSLLKEHQTIDLFLLKNNFKNRSEKLVLEFKDVLDLSRSLVRVYDDLQIPQWSILELNFKATAGLKDSFSNLRLKHLLDKLYFFESN